MASNKIAIIIPAYNEEASIGHVIKELIVTIGNAANVIVVNDHSPDQTSRIARKAGALVLDLESNHGYAKAIEQGLAYANKELNVDYLLTMDADGQHDPISVKLLIQAMIKGDFDLIVGIRSQSARFSEWLYGKYFSRRFDIYDPLCGLKVYRASLFQEYGVFETYDSIGTELLTWALLNKRNVHQLPVNIRSRKDEPRFGSSWSANKRIFVSLLQTFGYIRRRQ